MGHEYAFAFPPTVNYTVAKWERLTTIMLRRETSTISPHKTSIRNTVPSDCHKNNTGNAVTYFTAGHILLPDTMTCLGAAKLEVQATDFVRDTFLPKTES